MTAPDQADDRPYVCDTDDCRVLLYRNKTTGEWEHPPDLRERFSDHVCDDPDPGRPATPGEIRYGRGRTPNNEKIAIYDSIPELAPVDPATPLIIATDGSYKLEEGDNDGGTMRKPISWAYLSTNGQYGLGTTKLSGKLVGNKRSLQGELRAVFWALTKTPSTHPVTLITDSLDAVNLLDDWKAGGLTMPAGYDLVRENGRPSTLGQLAKRVRKNADLITVQWIRSHSGHPMNDAVDKMAKTARHWAMGRATKEKAEEVAYKLALEGLIAMSRQMAAGE